MVKSDVGVKKSFVNVSFLSDVYVDYRSALEHFSLLTNVSALQKGGVDGGLASVLQNLRFFIVKTYIGVHSINLLFDNEADFKKLQEVYVGVRDKAFFISNGQEFSDVENFLIIVGSLFAQKNVSELLSSNEKLVEDLYGKKR